MTALPTAVWGAENMEGNPARCIIVFAYSPLVTFPHFMVLGSFSCQGGNGAIMGRGISWTTGRPFTREHRGNGSSLRGQTGYTRAAIDGGANLIVCVGLGEWWLVHNTLRGFDSDFGIIFFALLSADIFFHLLSSSTFSFSLCVCINS